MRVGGNWQMDKKKFKKLTEKYTRLDEEYRRYRDQFFSVAWSGNMVKTPPKILNRKELDKLQAMHALLEKVHKEWLDVARSGEMDN